MNLKIRKHQAIIFSWLIGLGTAFAPLVGDGQRNYLVLLIVVLSAPILLTLRFRSLSDLSGSVLIIMYMITISLLNDVQNNLSSIIFTGLFMTTYSAFSAALAARMVTREEIIGLLRALILAFGAVSVLQAVTTLVGLPVPNLILSKGMWSYNSLAAEPSHLARVLSLTMLTYLTLLRIGQGDRLGPWKLLTRERLVFAAFLTSIALSGSALGLIAATLALLLAFKTRWLLVFAAVGVALWPVILLIDSPILIRVLSLLAALPSMDIETLARADHSASVRLMPAIAYLQRGIADFNEFLFGMGFDAVEPFFRYDWIGVNEGVAPGFFPGFLVAYGLIGTTMFLWIFVLRFLRPITLPFIFLWTVLFVTTGWNTQGFWFGLLIIRLMHHYTYAGEVGTAHVRFSQTARGARF